MLRRFSLLILVVLLLAPPAGAQSRDEVRARLAAFSGWAAPDRPLSLAVEVTNPGSTPLEDVAVRLTIRERVRSRSALRASLDGNRSGQNTLAVTTEQFDRAIDPGAKVTIQVARDLGSLATAFRPGRAISGVYPLGIAVQVGGRDAAAELPGAVVFLGSAPQAPLNLVWVMPIHRPFLADARGVYPRASIERELAPAGKARAIADLLTTHASAALTLAPTGTFADQLLDLSNGFRAASGGRTHGVATGDLLAQAANDLLARFKLAMASPAFELATTPYARASVPALVASGLTLDAGRQVTVGRERINAVFGRAPDASLFVDGSYRADARSARTYATLGAKTMILDPTSLRTPGEGRFGPDRVQDIRAANLSFDGLFVDTPIRARLELETKDPILTAMGVIAETAAAYLELPSLAAGRMLVIATGSTPDPAIASPLLDALAQAPWLHLRTASNAAGDLALRPTQQTQRLVSTPLESSARFSQARVARHVADTLGRVVVAPDGADELDRLDHMILVSESADYDAHPATGTSIARGARDRAQRRLGQISVPPRRVTLTSRSGRQVPVTVVNATGYDIRVRVRLGSPKVTFPAGATRTISVPGKDRGSTFGTLAFSLEAKAAGSFPLAVRLETPDGKDLIGTGQILIRSSAVSAVTFMATAGGALFLAVAWARRALSRRAKRAGAA